MRVLTTIVPFKTFLEAVGDDRIEVDVLVPPGASPHTWELTPRQVRRMSEASLYVKVGSGVEFETVWESKIVELNDTMMICDGSQGIELIGMYETDDDDENPTAHRRDPHIWLSPRNASRIVENIKECLTSVDPLGRSLYSRNADAYRAKLEDLDRTLMEELTEDSTAIFVLHPAWGYFARDYGLLQISIEAEGKEATPRQMARVVEKARRYGVTTIFASPHANSELARLVAREFGGTVAYADPLPENYINSLREFGQSILSKDD